MTRDRERPNLDGQPGDEPTLPVCRKDIQNGLRYVHEMLTTTQDEGIKAASYVRALAFILVDKGIIKPEELETLMRQVRWQIMQEPTPRVRLGSTRDKYTAAGAVDVDCASLIPNFRPTIAPFQTL